MPTQSYNTGNSIFDLHGAGQNVVADYQYITTLLDNIPDNTDNLIDAKDVRDAIWSLWSQIQDLSAISVTVSVDYDRTRPSTNTTSVGGVPTGSTFSGTIQDVLDRIFYPYAPPTCSLSGGGDRLFGSSTAVTLGFVINRKEKPITQITQTAPIIGSTPVAVPSTLSQPGTTYVTFTSGPSTTPPNWTTTATHSISPSAPGPISETVTYTLSVSDGTSTATAQSSVVWKNYLYYGTIDLSSLSNPNLTVYPDGSNQGAVDTAVLLVTAFVTDTRIKATAGTNDRPLASKQFATSFALNLQSYAAANKYLFFAWPTAFGTPTFKVNGSPNTAFTKVRSNSVFVNEAGWSGTRYDVWVSNTQYGTVDTFNIV